MRLKKNVKTIIVIVIAIAILTALGLFKMYVEKQNKVPENDPNLVGNTAGNIYNNGLFVEADGMVFFSNPYDGGAIYSMTTTQDNIKKVVGGHNSFLNLAGSFIYYYSSTSGEQSGLGYVRNGRGFYRSSLDGKKTYTLSKAETDSMILVGNHLYYTAFEEDPSKKDQAIVSIHSVTTGNENENTIINEHVKLGGYSNGNLYYAGMDKDHFLHSYNTGTGASSVVFEEYVYLPIISNGYVYYLDLNDNYKLKKYSLLDGSITLIANERVDTYNLYDDVIYYQNVDKDAYALKRVNIDGSGLEIVKTGVFNNINITSNYVYFTEFGNVTPIYQTSTHGSVNVSTFDGAMRAVIDSQK